MRLRGQVTLLLPAGELKQTAFGASAGITGLRRLLLGGVLLLTVGEGISPFSRGVPLSLYLRERGAGNPGDRGVFRPALTVLLTGFSTGC